MFDKFYAYEADWGTTSTDTLYFTVDEEDAEEAMRKICNWFGRT